MSGTPLGKVDRGVATCWCCRREHGLRLAVHDPWEGRLDDYCYDCALSRCDAYPGECPVERSSLASANVGGSTADFATPQANGAVSGVTGPQGCAPEPGA